MSHALVIVYEVTLGDSPSFTMLFPKGDEDGDHMVAEVLLPGPLATRIDAFRAARAYIDAVSLEELTEIRTRATPIDRTTLFGALPEKRKKKK